VSGRKNGLTFNVTSFTQPFAFPNQRYFAWQTALHAVDHLLQCTALENGRMAKLYRKVHFQKLRSGKKN